MIRRSDGPLIRLNAVFRFEKESKYDRFSLFCFGNANNYYKLLFVFRF